MERLIVFVFLCACGNSLAQNSQAQVADTKNDWLVYQSGQFIKYDHQPATAIYFWVDGRKEKAKSIWVAGKHPYSLFINSKLLLQGKGTIELNIDSLVRIYSSQLFVGVYTIRGVHHLQTGIRGRLVSNERDALLRKGNYFLDFSVLAALLLVVCFILFLRTNPTLTFDYLDINKLFSFQDRDESTLTLRIASSVNLLIYLFGSFFLGLMLLIALHQMGEQVSLALRFPIQSTAQGFWQWTVLSLIIFSLLVAKLLWLVILTALFGFRDTVSFQFFNFIRVILLAVGLLALICTMYFVFDVRQANYFFYLLTLLSTVFILGVAVIYFKLLARMPFHFFHLFSYLCASEIIPLMVLIKVFFY